jgi:hypothetical protein
MFLKIKTLSMALLLSSTAITSALAGPGHDHGDEAPTASGPSMPRFVAHSDNFELVGVIDGKTITLYLDQTASNAPVTKAQLELDFSGAKLQASAQPDGSFRVELPEAPKPGVIPITATVVTDGDADLLAGELDLHGEVEDAAHVHRVNWMNLLPAIVGGPVVFGAIVLWSRRKKKARFGSAA